MSRLKVLLRGTTISELILSPEKEYVGGRKEGCDIRLQAEKGISREHFKLKFADGNWQVIAISRFGDVFSLGQKVEQIELQHGQSFHVPPYDFTFLDLPESNTVDKADMQPIVNENTNTVLGAVPQVPYIKICDIKGEVREMLRLEIGEVWVAGRDPSCQIIIPDQRVSRRQFEVHKLNGAYTILDLASVNGTFLNGTPISSTDPQTLKSGDAISVLDNIMYFELHDPNFRYKVQNLAIPQMPLQADDVEDLEEVRIDTSVGDEYLDEVEDYEESSQIEQIEGFDVPQQLQTTDSPFTGIPAGPFDQNQFFTFNNQQQGGPAPGASTQAAPPPPAKKKLTQNKPLLITLVLLFLGAAYWLSENIAKDEEPIAVTTVVSDSDPFSRLTPEQQKEVQELYALAEQMYNQGKYDLALEKLQKIKDILPTGYKDSERIKMEADQAKLTFVQAEQDALLKKEREEQEAKIKKVIDECAKLISPTITAAEMNQCMAPVVAINPDNAEYMRLMGEAEKIEREKQQKESEQKSREQEIADFKKLFNDAEKIQKQGYAFKAIKKYEIVLESSLPDPDNLKKEAEERITYIKTKIKDKSQGSIANADNFLKQGNLKQAVITLREAQVYDPENPDIKEKIDSYSYELMRKVREIYQEAIIDENYGIIENTDSREGAKQKWKKITEMDLEDGEYYKKAIVKLRRYGVM